MWLRAWETWKIPEKQIVDNLLSLPLIKVVNSIGLQEKLAQYGHKSYLIRPGNTLEDFYPKKLVPKKIKLDLDYVNSLLGVNLSKQKVIKILKDLGFEISTSAKQITVKSANKAG